MLVVARLLIGDFSMEHSDMAGICGISRQEISSAMKKIQKTLDEGHILIGLNASENEVLIRNIELRRRGQRFLEDALIRQVAKLLLKDHRMTCSRIAKALNETASNISRAMKKIKERMECGTDPPEHSMITGLSEKENRQLRERLIAREKETQKEKDLRQQERALEKANKESMKDMNVARKKIGKKPATISPEGLAEWNRMHYDHRTGQLLIGNAPADLPRKYPKKQIAAQMNTPDSYLIPAPLAKASGTAAGRRRISVMQLC